MATVDVASWNQKLLDCLIAHGVDNPRAAYILRSLGDITHGYIYTVAAQSAGLDVFLFLEYHF